MYIDIDRKPTLCPKAAALLSIPEEWSSIDILTSRHSALPPLLSLPLCSGNKHTPSIQLFLNNHGYTNQTRTSHKKQAICLAFQVNFCFFPPVESRDKDSAFKNTTKGEKGETGLYVIKKPRAQINRQSPPPPPFENFFHIIHYDVIELCAG